MKPIPEEDLKAINDSFKQTPDPVETISKNVHGRVVEAKRKIVNETTIVFESFSGRVLCRQKSIFIPKQGLKIIGVRGQKYDDIVPAERQLVVWVEDDFEPKNGG